MVEAAFWGLVGASALVVGAEVAFEDIVWMQWAGITKGCGNDRYCPNDSVTRGQMAAFLVRALGLTDKGAGNLFVDHDESIFEDDIDRLATAGITKGCNPPVNDRFCPGSRVTRAQMAALLHRALGGVLYPAFVVNINGEDLLLRIDPALVRSD